jgi:hypothetical protein
VAIAKAPVAPLTGCDAVRAEAAKYSGWDVATITAISQAESGCKVDATGDKTLTYQINDRIYGYSVSVLQVRILPGREHCDSHELTINVKCAYVIWQSQGYNAWTKYQTGEYREFL